MRHAVDRHYGGDHQNNLNENHRIPAPSQIQNCLRKIIAREAMGNQEGAQAFPTHAHATQFTDSVGMQKHIWTSDVPEEYGPVYEDHIEKEPRFDAPRSRRCLGLQVTHRKESYGHFPVISAGIVPSGVTLPELKLFVPFRTMSVVKPEKILLFTQALFAEMFRPCTPGPTK